MEKTFEASLNQLETIVRQLEEGDLPLEESLKLFEKGVKLARECRDRLNDAERRIEILMKDENGNLALKDIDPGDLRDGTKSGSKKGIVFDQSAEDDAPF